MILTLGFQFSAPIDCDIFIQLGEQEYFFSDKLKGSFSDTYDFNCGELLDLQIITDNDNFYFNSTLNESSFFEFAILKNGLISMILKN